MVKHSAAVFDALTREPKTIATVLFSKGFISQDALEEVTTLDVTPRDNARKLQLAVMRVVENTPHRYDDFVSILKENTPLYGELLSLLDTSYKGLTPQVIHTCTCMLMTLY